MPTNYPHYIKETRLQLYWMCTLVHLTTYCVHIHVCTLVSWVGGGGHTLKSNVHVMPSQEVRERHTRLTFPASQSTHNSVATRSPYNDKACSIFLSRRTPRPFIAWTDRALITYWRLTKKGRECWCLMRKTMRSCPFSVCSLIPHVHLHKCI